MYDRQLNNSSFPMPILLISNLDHLTPATGVLATYTISKGGSGIFAAPVGAITETGNGWYSLNGNVSDRNVLGGFIIHATGIGIDTSDSRYNIVPWNPFDASQGMPGVQALPTGIAGTPGNLPVLTAFTGIPIDLYRSLDLNNTGDTVGGALIAGRSQGFGVWKTVNGSGIGMYDATATVLLHTHYPSPTGNPISRL